MWTRTRCAPIATGRNRKQRSAVECRLDTRCNALLAAAAPIPIIDTHFHFYDQTRPQGAPFPFTPNAPPFLPRHTVPLGIAGGIKVEASPWVEDNLWVLMIIEEEPLIGNLDPLKPEFRKYLDRYRRNKLFLARLSQNQGHFLRERAANIDPCTILRLDETIGKCGGESVEPPQSTPPAMSGVIGVPPRKNNSGDPASTGTVRPGIQTSSTCTFFI